jgi:hypothetical protein
VVLSQINASTALAETNKRLSVFQAGLVKRVDSQSMTRRSGVTFKIFALRELLLHRITALIEAAIEDGASIRILRASDFRELLRISSG